MFAFSQVEAGTRGQIEKPQIPLNRYLGAAWDQGLHDSMGGSLYRISEQFQIDHDVSLWGLLDQQAGRTLSAEEANASYGRPRLQFTEPVKEGVASLMSDRHRENEERNYLLSEGATSVARIAGSFGVGMLASLANPVDFTTMFFPIVGSEAAAAKLGALGAGSIRQGLARGLISEQALGSSRLAAAVIEGTVGQAVAEIPLYISNRMDQTPYTLADSALNVLLGGVFATGIRLSLDSAGRLIKKLSPETREATFKKAASDFLAGENIEVHKLVELDEAAIRETVRFDATAARAQALLDADAKMPEIRAWAEAQMDVDGHLGTVDQPNLLKIANDWLPIWEAQGKDVTMLQKLLANVLADPSPTNLQNLASQFNLRFEPLDKKFPSQYYLSPDPERQRMMKAAGVEEGDLVVPGQVANETRRRQSAELATQRELKMQKLIGDEKERRVKAYVQELRDKFNPEQETRRKVNAEISRQQKDGKVLSEEQVSKYEPSAVSDESDIAVLQKDVDELKKSLGIEEEPDDVPMGKTEDPKTAVDRVIAALESIKMKDLPPGTRHSGIPPEVWNGFVDLVIEGVKAGQKLADVLDRVIARVSMSLEEAYAFRMTVYEKLSDARFAKDEGIPEGFFPEKKMTRKENEARAKALHLSMGYGIDYEAKIAELVELPIPKKGTALFHGRRIDAPPAYADDLIWTTDNGAVAADYAVEFGGGGQGGEGGRLFKLALTKELNPARPVDIALAVRTLGHHYAELSASPLDHLYDSRVVKYLKQRGFDSAIGLDPFGSDEITAVILFDPRRQVKPIEAVVLDGASMPLAKETTDLSKVLFSEEFRENLVDCLLK